MLALVPILCSSGVREPAAVLRCTGEDVVVHGRADENPGPFQPSLQPPANERVADFVIPEPLLRPDHGG